MDIVLDLDLDFFVTPTATWPQWEHRAPVPEYEVSPTEDVRGFLEDRCHLNVSAELVGQQVVDHDGAFWTWKRWIEEGKLTIPFKIIHVDAHADVGLGDAGWMYLMTELLALPLHERSIPTTGRSGMNEGNYLTFAVANRWVKDILFVYPHRGSSPESKTRESMQSRPGDLLNYHFHHFDPLTRKFELKQYTKEEANRLVMGSKKTHPVRVEPAIPYDWVSGDRFQFEGFTHILVAQSPRYTPASADALLPVIGEYYIRG